MRARGRLLLLGRYHLWRLEAYHCEACWESSPEAVKAAVDAAKAEVDQRCASLRTDVITFANVLRFDDDNFLEHTKGFVFAVSHRPRWTAKRCSCTLCAFLSGNKGGCWMSPRCMLFPGN